MNTRIGTRPRRPSSARGGFTLLEVLVGSCVAILIAGTALLLVLASAKEARRGVADATVEQVAGLLQNKIVGYLRSMSATEGVIFSGPVADAGGGIAGYTSIIIAQGPAPDFPREQITFEASQGRVIYDPNRAVPDNELVLEQNGPVVVIRQVTFSPSLKQDGTPDNALINVLIKLDDNHYSGRAVSANPASVWRSFSVRMRNS